MVRFLYFLAYSVFFIFALLFFVPKTSLYHYAEKELQKQKLVFSNEELIDKSFALALHGIDVSYDSIESVNVENAEIVLFVFFNHIRIENIVLSDMAASFLPLKIENLDIKYTLWNPLKVFATSKGEFGEASAVLSILDRNASVLLEPSDLMRKKYKKTLNKLKKNAEGGYEYAKTF